MGILKSIWNLGARIARFFVGTPANTSGEPLVTTGTVIAGAAGAIATAGKVIFSGAGPHLGLFAIGVCRRAAMNVVSLLQHWLDSTGITDDALHRWAPEGSGGRRHDGRF